MFKNQKEMIKALLDGKTIINESGNKYVLNDEGMILHTTYTPNFNRYDNWQEYKAPQWFDNIPEKGVLCWVNDLSVVRKDIASVIIKRCGDKWFSSKDSVCWKFATPVKPEECYQGLK